MRPLIAFFFLFFAGSIPAHAEAEQPKDAPYPRIAMLWNAGRGERSPEAIARHDLMLLGASALGLEPNRRPIGLADGFTTPSYAVARERVAGIRRLNPEAVLLVEIYFYEYRDEWLPPDHPWWLRKEGKRLQFWPGTWRMDWSHPDYRQQVIRKTAALKEAGVDGVFYDNLRKEPEPWVAFLSDLRQAVGDDFLVLANAGYAIEGLDFVAPFLNGFMYESGWSHNRTDWADGIRAMRHTQTLLREPRISVIERFEDIGNRAGWPGNPNRGKKPPADPAARRWTLCYALIMGDFYYLFADNTSHVHDWYPEYDIKIGQPSGPGQSIDTHVWTRTYEKALVAVNLPGAKAPYTLKTDQRRKDIFSGHVGTEFTIPPGEGVILAPV